MPQPRIIHLLQESLIQEKDNWILWIPVIFGCGIIFYFQFPHSGYLQAICLSLFCVLTYLLLRKELSIIIPITIAIFLSGFLWTKIYTTKLSYTPQLQHQLYAVAIGKVESLKSYKKNSSTRIILNDLQLYKSRYSTDNKKLPKNIKKKPKTRRNRKDLSRDYLNFDDHQDIERSSYKNYNFDPNIWNNNRLKKPPKKISISIRNSKVNIGGIIQVKVLLEPFKKQSIIGEYDFARDAYFKGIGASGYLIGKIHVIEKNITSDFAENIQILRLKVADKILQKMEENSAGIAIALLVGIRDHIPNDSMENIRNSGLAHLLAISGLHLTLSTAIFFIFFRFILSANQYLTLNYNIKKIAAVIAVIAGFLYLLIAGTPIPAIRAFIMISLVFTAILIDKNPNPLRSVALAALIILIFNPSTILSISFQLSFSAIIALISFYQYFQKLCNKESLLSRFIFYFFTIILSSIIASIATAPLTIYHFNNYAGYSVLANLLAIPIATLLTMPLGFVSLLLMPFGIEGQTIYLMELSINLIIKIAKFVSEIPYSHQTISMISSSSLGFIIAGGLWLLLWQKNWRLLGIIPIIFGIILAYKTQLPDLLIDGDAKFFAIYNKEHGLVFNKNIRDSSKRKNWLKKMGESEFKSLKNQDIEGVLCNKQNCQLTIKTHKILILTQRNKTNDICQNQSDILVNITKYKLPDCVKNKVIINNLDLHQKGGHFLYFKDSKQVRIKTIQN